MVKYFIAGGFVLLLIVTILLLKLQVADLKADKKTLQAEKAQLTVDLAFSKNQTQALIERETSNDEIRKNANQARSSLRNLQNGDVADVLRRAVDVDVVRGEP